MIFFCHVLTCHRTPQQWRLSTMTPLTLRWQKYANRLAEQVRDVDEPCWVPSWGGFMCGGCAR
eukprot:4209326-Amphidinium_carterae.1